MAGGEKRDRACRALPLWLRPSLRFGHKHRQASHTRSVVKPRFSVFEVRVAARATPLRCCASGQGCSWLLTRRSAQRSFGRPRRAGARDGAKWGRTARLESAPDPASSHAARLLQASGALTYRSEARPHRPKGPSRCADGGSHPTVSDTVSSIDSLLSENTKTHRGRSGAGAWQALSPTPRQRSKA